MNYEELIAKALNGRSVNSVSKMWGLPQKTLDRYVKGESMPDFDTAWKIATDAGVDPGEAFKTLAAEQRMHKSKQFKLQSGFVQTTLLTCIATCCLVATVYIM